MVNIETGIVLRELLGVAVDGSADRPDVPVVLRVYDRALGAAVAHRFGFENVRSTVELAAPWFIGAAMGLQVIGTFSVGQRSFMVGGVHVQPGSELDGMRDGRPVHPDPGHRDLPAGQPARCTRAATPGSAPGTPPTWSGPYRELLDTLRKGQGAQQSDVTDPATTG